MIKAPSRSARRGSGRPSYAAAALPSKHSTFSKQQARTGVRRGGFKTIDYTRAGDSVGAPHETLLEAAQLVRSGLPFAALARFQKASGLTLARIKQVARISEGSFARRKRAGRLSQDESERLLRVGRIFEHATALYEGDQAGARQWIETPIPALGHQRPLDLAQTEPGAREVEDLIGRIEHGVVS